MTERSSRLNFSNRRWLWRWCCSWTLSVLIGCSTPTEQANTDSNVTDSSSIDETAVMVQRLRDLVKNGNPEELYHWNSRLADLWLSRIKTGTPQQQLNAWFEYCRQKLYSGDPTATIEELEGYLQMSGKPYDELLDEKTRGMFELLALAYLRLGEQENCQAAHTPQSCILPLQPPGQHQLTNGSQKAKELYTLLQSKFPSDRNRWLLNLACMTLAEHPDRIPQGHLIPFPSPNEQRDFPRFEEVAMHLGLAVDGLSGGCITDDFNNDGWLDIFATSYGMEDQVKLFLNDGKGGFVDVTSSSGLIGIVSGLNCMQCDYNNDGLLDIFILRGAWLGKGGRHPNSLLKNLGDGRFSDVTESSGLLTYHPTQTAGWSDFDRDGDLDAFIGNEGKGNDPHPCELFQNNGDGTFTEVASQFGLGNINAFVKGVTWGDINNDRWPDLYVSVLGGNNLLFKNTTEGFEEVGGSAGVREPFFSFPTWFWDVNQDGWQDLFVCGYDLTNLDGLAGDYAAEFLGNAVKTEKPRLFINNGDGTFADRTAEYGIDRTMYGMGANFGDLDNDGFPDFYVGTGAPDFSTVVPNRMFRNVNGKRFEEVTSAGGFGHIQKGHGVAFADFDHDGDQDIYAVMGGALEGDNFTNVLFENPISANNWIIVEVLGAHAGRAAIGAQLELELDNGKILYYTANSGGSFGASSLQQEIGLGSASLISTLRVHWPTRDSSAYANIRVNQKVRLVKGASEVEVIRYEPMPFAKGDGHNHHQHHQ